MRSDYLVVLFSRTCLAPRVSGVERPQAALGRTEMPFEDPRLGLLRVQLRAFRQLIASDMDSFAGTSRRDPSSRLACDWLKVFPQQTLHRRPSVSLQEADHDLQDAILTTRTNPLPTV